MRRFVIRRRTQNDFTDYHIHSKRDSLQFHGKTHPACRFEEAKATRNLAGPFDFAISRFFAEFTLSSFTKFTVSLFASLRTVRKGANRLRTAEYGLKI
jgi:hypothetical protein